MRSHIFVIDVIFLILCTYVNCKGDVKSLGESANQDLIKISNPDKGGLEEESSAESDEEEKLSVTPLTTINKELKNQTKLPETRKKMKDIDVVDGLSSDDEESRIAKELAEIYKDNSDYKDSSESVKEMSTVIVEDASKTELKQRNNLKFQPDLTDKEEVERFRTSVDDISCGKVNRLTATPSPNSGYSNDVNLIMFHIITFLLIFHVCL